ncbi:MAG: universal stress protein [Pseudomonadota bacterium]
MSEAAVDKPVMAGAHTGPSCYNTLCSSLSSEKDQWDRLTATGRKRTGLCGDPRDASWRWVRVIASPTREVSAVIPKKILLCTDFSENSYAACDTALRFAVAFQAELEVINVIDIWAGLPMYSDNVPLDIREVVASLEEAARASLKDIERKPAENGIQVTTTTIVGVPAREIVEIAEAGGIDLIVMGTHGWTGIRHVVMGSTAETVMRTAKCPVVTVKSRRKK